MNGLASQEGGSSLKNGPVRYIEQPNKTSQYMREPHHGEVEGRARRAVVPIVRLETTLPLSGVAMWFGRMAVTDELPGFP